MILRIWRGWTAPEDADAYEAFLTGGSADSDQQSDSDENESALEAMTGEGYLGFELGRREDGDEVEFVTILRFEDYDAVEAFAGEAYEQAHVPAAAQELLSRWEDEVTHYERRAGEQFF